MILELPELEVASKRHPTLEVLCSRLEAIMTGRAAAALLEHPAAIPARAGLVILPSWSWLRPLIDVGRKDKEYGTGEGLLMPVRTEWTPGPVIVVGEESQAVSYRTIGMGHKAAGQTRLIRRAGEEELVSPAEVPSLSNPVFVGAAPRRTVIASLEALAAAGHRARWEIINELEPRVMQTIRKAHSAVSHEVGISSGLVQPMLDEIGLEEVLAAMMYGEREVPGEKERPGSIFRLIELCLSPKSFVIVDLLKWIGKHGRRDAETQIRRKLGDPHIGPKIREIARRYQGSDISVVVAEYRKVYPKDRLSLSRAQAALSVSPDAMARSTLLEAETLRVETSDAKGTAAL